MSKETVTQSSMGDNSPNVVGNNNFVVVLPQSFRITEHCLDGFLMSHTQGDWEDETPRNQDTAWERWISRKDRRVSYVVSYEEDYAFYEPWLNFISRPDPTTKTGWIEFFFEQTPVFKKHFVSLDGLRFEIPFPQVKYHDGFLKGEFSGKKERVGIGGKDLYETFYDLDHHPVEKVIWTKLDLKIASFLVRGSFQDYLDILRKKSVLEVVDGDLEAGKGSIDSHEAPLME